jgi:heptosyltransferase-2
VFATKKWHQNRYVEVIERMYHERGAVPVLLGGADESPLLEWMQLTLKKKGIPVLRPGEQMNLRQFASVIGQCDGLICGDTLAMHLGLSQGVKSVVIFTSTCPQEIELYGIGRAIVGKAACAPCYRSVCNQPSQYCADSVTVDQVFKTATELMGLDQEDGQKIRRSSNF